MSEFIRVADIDDIPEGRGLCVHHDGRAIGLFKVDGEVLAIDDVCTHAHAHLSEGEVSGDEVVCPLHFATFNLRTGEATAPPASEDVATFPVRVDGEDVFVQLP